MKANKAIRSVKHQVRNQVWDQTDNQACGAITDTAITKVWHEVRGQVMVQACSQVRTTVSKLVRKALIRY